MKVVIKPLERKDLLATITVVYIVLSSNSVYMQVYKNIGPYVHVGLLIIGMLWFLSSSRRITRRVLFGAIIIASVFMIDVLMARLGTDYFFILIRFFAVAAIVIALHNERINILDVTYNGIFMLVAITLAMYIIFDLLFPSLGLTTYYHIVKRTDGTITRALYNIHYGIYIRWATNSHLFNMNIPRLSGFTNEPGIYQMYLNYCLIYLLYINKKKPLHFIVTLTSLFFANSTMGWLIAVVAGVVRVWNQKNRVLKFGMTIVSLPIFIYSIYSLIQDKMMNSAISFQARSSELSLIGDILFRNGFWGVPNSYRDMVNSFIRFCTYHGYIGIIIIILCCYSYLKNNCFNCSISLKVVLFVWFVLSLLNEPLEYANFTFFILSIAIMDRDKICKNGQKKICRRSVQPYGKT